MTLSKAAPPCLTVHIFPSALGWFAAAGRDQQLLALSFGHRDPAAARQALFSSRRDLQDPDVGLKTGTVRPGSAELERLAARLQAYAEGQHDDFLDIVLDLSEQTDFQRRVSLACRGIAYGHSASYAQLAAQIGSPGAARAVGSVMARNCWPILIPCHRVLGAGGRLGGYSAPGGLATKRRLLELEAGA